MIVKGTTSTGFEYEYDDRAIADADNFMDPMLEITEGNLTIGAQNKVMKKAVIWVLGADQFERLKAHIKEHNDGFCSYPDILDEFGEITHRKLDDEDTLKN